MRKLVIILLFIIEAVLIFEVMFEAEKSYRLNDFFYAESRDISFETVLQMDQENAGKNFDVLISLADQLNANVIVSRLINDDGRNRYTKYVYINRPEFYQRFAYEGEWVYPENNTSQFLSTVATGDPEQTGRMIGFGRDNTYEIRPLQEMLNGTGSLNGIYTIQIDSKKITIFCEAFSEQTGVLMEKEEEAEIVLDEFSGLLYLILLAVLICIHLLITLVVVYDFTKEYKGIAVEKMLGHWEYSIWRKRIFRLLRNQVCAIAPIFLLMILIRVEVMNPFTLYFFLKLFAVGICIVVSTYIFANMTYKSIAKVSIIDMLKNRRPLRLINTFNMITKIALMSLVIYLGQGALYQYTLVSDFYAKSFGAWEKTQNFYIIDGIANVSKDEFSSAKNRGKREAIYSPFNKNGGILADFQNFTPTAQAAKARNPNGKYFSATVNPNYLKEFPIYKSDGEVVEIGENVANYILLVPEAFRSEEAQLLEYYNRVKRDAEEDKIVSSDVLRRDQEISIIWVKDDQKYFTYNLSINSNDGNMISHIILAVLTEKNGVRNEYNTVMGASGNPFKIKTLSANPESEIRNVLKENELDQYVNTIVSVHDNVLQETTTYQQMIGIALLAIGILLLTLSMLIVQSIYIYFDKNKRLISIRTIMGQPFWLKYWSYFAFNVLATWAVIMIVTIVLNRTQPGDALLFALLLMATEILVSFLTILVSQKRKILKTLKGGN